MAAESAEVESVGFFLSQQQRSILRSIVRQTHCPQAVAARARAVLAAGEGMGPSEAARESGVNRNVARVWRDRFAIAQRQWAEASEPMDEATLTGKILDALEDRERSGAPTTFTPEQLCQIMAVACGRPEECGRPVSHWSARELADEAKKRGIVPGISRRHVARFLKAPPFARIKAATG